MADCGHRWIYQEYNNINNRINIFLGKVTINVRVQSDLVY